MKMRLDIIVLFCLLLSISGNKYSQDANSASATDFGTEQKFRVQKLNFIWSKAVRTLTKPEQNELFLHLKRLDKQFLAAKYERNGGGDSEGVMEKELESALENLLNRYGLAAIYDALADKRFDGATKDRRNEADRSGTAKSKPATFKDQKLRKLWMDAVATGDFDSDELLALEEEFEHHQKKLDESNNARNKLPAEEKENSVLHEDFDEDHRTKANSELKQRFKDIQQGYDSLKTKVVEKVQTRKNISPITHPRVFPLLEKARATYSGPELESIEEELRHFEARLKKLEYLEREARQGKAEIDSSAKSVKKQKSAKIYDREVVDQFSDYSRKVEKYEKYLASKLEL